MLIPVLAWMNVFEWFGRFPFSLSSVVLIHVLMDTGLAAVFFSRLFTLLPEKLTYWAYLHNISRWQFLKKILFYSCRTDLILIFILTFSFYFTSFSVPLLVGGTSGRTLEVLIAEKLNNPNDWPIALSLFAVQTVFLFIFFLWLYKKKSPSAQSTQSHKVFPLSEPALTVFAVTPSILLLAGLIDSQIFLAVFKNWAVIDSAVFYASLHTMALGLLTGVFVLIGLTVTAFCLKHFFLRNFLTAYTGSSTAFMAFVFLLVEGEGVLMTQIKWALGLSLLFLPALYKLMGEMIINRLEKQVKTAELMGAGPIKIFSNIVWPQCAPQFLFLAGISAFWASGDFAYSGLVSFEEQHLAMLIKDIFSSYRFDLAVGLNWLLMILGGLCFSLFAGVGFVFYKKSYLPHR